MANMNIRTPRFYTDLVSYHRARGYERGTVTTTGGSGATATRGLQTGTAAELFDLRPLNKVDFDTSGDTDARVLTNYIFTSSSYRQNYIAILNHNLNTAKGKIRVFASSTASQIQTVNGTACDTADINWSSVTVTEVVNADSGAAASDNKSYAVEPATDGTTIFTFTEQNLRYWAIQFEGADGDTSVGTVDGDFDGTTDLFIGGIMLGESYSMPHAPDLSVNRSIIYDKVKVQESTGGQRFANATSFGRTASATSKSPFSLGIASDNVYGGRLAYDLNFSYLNSTDVMPDEYSVSDRDDDAVVEDIWNKVDGPHRPFIFSIDKDSEGNNAESEHIFARFAQSSLDMTQVANDVFNVSMRIEEEF